MEGIILALYFRCCCRNCCRPVRHACPILHSAHHLILETFQDGKARLLDYVCLQGKEKNEMIPPEKIWCCPPLCGEYSAVDEAENNEKHMAGLVYPLYFQHSERQGTALKPGENKTSITENRDTRPNHSQGTRDFVCPILQREVYRKRQYLLLGHPIDLGDKKGKVSDMQALLHIWKIMLLILALGYLKGPWKVLSHFLQQKTCACLSVSPT